MDLLLQLPIHAQKVLVLLFFLQILINLVFFYFYFFWVVGWVQCKFITFSFGFKERGLVG